MVEWQRVIMDEVQMVGGGKTEYVSICITYQVIGCSDHTTQGDGVTDPALIKFRGVWNACTFNC